MINTVNRDLIDTIINLYNPEKIVIFVSDDDYTERKEYESIYNEYKDLITLYEGDVQLHIKAYMNKNPGKVFSTISSKWEMYELF